MPYAGFLIRRERMQRNWSQEGLCRGICTVSYLSKIEQGKAQPSDEVLALLFARMGLTWHAANGAALVEQGYDALFSGEREALCALAQQTAWAELAHSPWGLDQLLLSGYAADEAAPLETAFEACMDDRQLALQRCLQGRDGEAVRLYPCGYLYALAGDRCYRRGDTAHAMEWLQTGHRLAAKEGRARVMLYTRMIMGNCYSNLHDLRAMESHYAAARRLALALNATEELATLDYNTAATQMELGDWAGALGYFEALAEHTRLTLHKLAICYEKLGQNAKALEAIRQAEEAPPYISDGIDSVMCQVVRFRLEHGDYLERSAYGELLLHCFELCRTQLPSGYTVFHLPWVLEWYEHHRQYKAAYTLLRDFPEYEKNR